MSDVRIHRRDLLKGAGAAAGALLLPAGVRAAEPAPRKGGTLRITMPFNPASVDPMTGRNLPDFNVLYAIFDALIDFDPDTLELKPGLAKTWRFSDPKTLVLDLVEGIDFHDGSPFNPEAVRFNIERCKTDPRSNVKADLGTVAACEVTGKNQVTLHLARPNAGLPAILTNRIGLMVSPKSVKAAEKGNVDRAPVGTGPFKFVSWEDNASFKLTRNPNYWRSGLPYLDGLAIRIVNEMNTAARTAMAGQADLVLNMRIEQKLAADKSKSVIATAMPSMSVYGAFLNFGRPPLDDVRVRQALNYALDREAINTVINRGLAETTSAIMTRKFWATDPETAGYYSHDPERAKKLLAEAGHANGLDLGGWGWPDQTAVQDEEVVVSQLAQAGIRLKVAPALPAQAMQNFLIQKRGAALITPTGGYPDPSQFYEALFAKTALRNAAKIELPGYRALVDATTTAQDRASRKAAFAKLQRFVVEQAMYLPQFILPGVTIATPKVKNFTNGLLMTPKFTQVWLEA